MNIIGLMACTKSGVIGLNGEIPWRYPSELKHFQEMTRNQIIIMGRKTFDAISELNLLKNRENIVFTRNKIPADKYPEANITLVNSLAEFSKLKLTNNKKIYMIGGGEIAKLFLQNNLIKKFILTRINNEYQGDAYFPLSLIKRWDATKMQEHKNYTIYQYQKIK